MAIFNKKSTERKPRPGGRRPAVNTYYRSESKSSDSPFEKKQPKRPIKKFIFGFMDVIIITGLLIVFFYALALKSTPVIDSNDFSYHQKMVYAAVAREQFSRLQNRNKITFNETGIAGGLQKKFPEISAVQIELPLFSEQPVLHLTVAKPIFILNSQGSSLVVDSNGVAVAPASTLGIKGLPVITDNSGYVAKSGSEVLSPESVSFINTLLAECQWAKIPVGSLTLPAEPQELQLRTKDAPYYLKFYLGGDALEETGQFLAARQHFIQTHQPPAQYLDVRVSGKVFYK